MEKNTQNAQNALKKPFLEKIKKITVKDILSILFISFLLTVIVSYSYTKIEKANNSYISACVPGANEKLENKGIVTAATTSIGFKYQNITNEETNKTIIKKVIDKDSIKVKVEDGFYNIKVLKHEYCHVKQYKKEFVPTCNQRILKTTSELECYIAEDFPDFIYNKIYGEINIK